MFPRSNVRNARFLPYFPVFRQKRHPFRKEKGTHLVANRTGSSVMRAARPAHVIVPPVMKGGRNVKGETGMSDTGPTAPLEIDRRGIASAFP